jgi:hypothetical protein
MIIVKSKGNTMGCLKVLAENATKVWMNSNGG